MTRVSIKPTGLTIAWCIVVITCLSSAVAQETQRVDLLSFAQGALPIGIGDGANEMRIGMSQALQVIDGNGGGFVLTPKPGGDNAEVVFVYALPALTTFDAFVIPNVLETPSPSQTFFKTVSIAGSEVGPDGPFEELARTTLETHASKGETTSLSVTTTKPVQWVRVTLTGGINIEREKTFFEFSEVIGYGVQEEVPLLESFSGKWRGRGVKVELKQEGVRVSGCYDGEGELTGTVRGNLLHATGQTPSGIESTFVLSVGSNNELIGVRSTNGAPFRLYSGDVASSLTTKCSERPVAPIGCGSVIHGIHFDFDSATIRPESEAHLDALYDGLKGSAPKETVTVVGHTSSEGDEAYNEALSERRARAVVIALVTRGIETGRIAAEGLGEQQPIADNSSEAGRSLNRRVEIRCR